MSRDPRDEEYATDRDGNTWLVGSAGEFVRINGRRVPGPARRVSKPGEFVVYDSSRGHCGLCGSLTCNGRCFC